MFKLLGTEKYLIILYNLFVLIFKQAVVETLKFNVENAPDLSKFDEFYK